MTKVLLLDIDGVLTLHRSGYFSDRLITDFNISSDNSKLFVNEILKPSLTGKLDLKPAFAKLLNDWGINKSVNEMFEYWWAEENKLNIELLNEMKILKSQGIQIYLASNQEQYRANCLKDLLGNYIEGAFFSCELGFLKEEKGFWLKVLNELSQFKPSEIIYFDDDQANIESAKEFGINSCLYTNLADFKNSVASLS